MDWNYIHQGKIYSENFRTLLLKCPSLEESLSNCLDSGTRRAGPLWPEFRRDSHGRLVL
jgi:hypothetical protein